MNRPATTQRPEFADAPAATSHVAVIKRFGKIALTMILFAVVVTGIVALKAVIWIPH
jgi:hypothetical protein